MYINWTWVWFSPLRALALAVTQTVKVTVTCSLSSALWVEFVFKVSVKWYQGRGRSKAEQQLPKNSQMPPAVICLLFENREHWIPPDWTEPNLAPSLTGPAALTVPEDCPPGPAVDLLDGNGESADQECQRSPGRLWISFRPRPWRSCRQETDVLLCRPGDM